jgi:hypothetical protein
MKGGAPTRERPNMAGLEATNRHKIWKQSFRKKKKTKKNKTKQVTKKGKGEAYPVLNIGFSNIIHVTKTIK